MVIYIGDIFEANKFNDGFWQGSSEYDNTFLDSHYYQGKNTECVGEGCAGGVSKHVN